MYDNLGKRCMTPVPGSSWSRRCQQSRGEDGRFEVPGEEEKNLRVGVSEGVAGPVVMAGEREGGRDLPFLREVKRDLTVAREECVRRGLLHTTKWWVRWRCFHACTLQDLSRVRVALPPYLFVLTLL